MIERRPIGSIIFVCMMIFLVTACDTTRSVYRRSISKKEYLTVKVTTLSHCGCTQIYAESYKDGKLAFQVFYSDQLSRKWIYEYSGKSKTPRTHSLLATTSENYTTAFDPLDLEVYRVIDSVISNKQGIVYPIRRAKYRGYVADTLSRIF